MHTDDDVTEITSLEATKIAGVGAPANRTPFVLLKAKQPAEDKADDAKSDDEPKTKFGENAGHKLSDDARDAFRENAERVKNGDKPAKKTGDPILDPAPAEKSDSAEADHIQDEVTGSAAKASSYCGDPECAECVKAELVPLTVRTTIASGVAKAELKAADRKKMPESQFAYVDPKGGKHLPIHDEAHVRAALARFNEQDFSDAEDPAKAKQQAAEKIKAAADKFGIKVSDDTDVAHAAKGAVQDALHGTAAPEAAGVLDGSQSGVAGPATGSALDRAPHLANTASGAPGMIDRLAGGESAYAIPAEDRLGVTNTPPNDAAITKAAMLARVARALHAVEAERQARKDAGYLSVLGPTAQQSAAPGSMPWESYDSATLDQVAQTLAACCNAIDCIATREQIEALSGDAGDYQDAWDLQDAGQCLEYAMGVVARLAYAEGAEATKADADTTESVVEKAYRRLRAADHKALRDAHAAIANVLAEHDRAQGQGKGEVADAGQKEPSEGDKIQMELTKEELAEAIVAGAKQVIKADRDAAEKEARRAAKKAEKKAAKKAAKAEAKKNANNGGDITAQQMADQVHGQHDADDVQAVGGKVQPQYVNKSEGDSEPDPMLKAMQEQISALGEQVQKFAKRPRTGGPVLDGQPRGGVFPAGESRMADVSKSSDVDDVVKSLEEKYENAPTPLAKQELGFQLTHARLRAAHEQGRI